MFGSYLLMLRFPFKGHVIVEYDMFRFPEDGVFTYYRPGKKRKQQNHNSHNNNNDCMAKISLLCGFE